ncbi:copper-binding protein [Rhodobacter veldkampii DSM 11550]|uniref:copper chaperone PCu(A)C n=1 Tax=Phaeovulum veldkampii TaxID=33049 RepID=UPI0010616EFE|nr:copper chaperone PCu(A)C [Phaeovulum veldkampii]MBK5947656.1 copper-binding protein [Phaeovulum veldkampii DSM 11550]TDQ56106.1 hypothetical protein EV658_1228 [Phaeovulum veldkampii DSM 11550]
MTLHKYTLTAAAIAFSLGLAVPALAEIVISDPYARVSAMMSKSGAAFMVIENTGAEDDRLVSAASDIAAKVELHTHKADANGVMQMIEVPEGFVIPAGGQHVLERGADHVMFLGLHSGLEHGQNVTVTLTFEKAGPMTVQMPVDLKRGMPMMGQGMPAAAPMGQMHGQPAN